MILGLIQLFFAAYTVFISIIFIWTIVEASSFWKSLLIRWMVCVMLLLHLQLTCLITGMTSGELEKRIFSNDGSYNKDVWFIFGIVIFVGVTIYTTLVTITYHKKQTALRNTVLQKK